jgi:nucleoside-diphosphate-sugar epimerase
MTARTKDLFVVLGASGGVGSALVAQLAAEGRRVRAVSRRPVNTSATEHLIADVSTPEGERAACVDARVVFHAAQPPYHRWGSDFPALTAAVIAAAGESGAKLVMVDNLYMYGPAARPLDETLPRAATGRKGIIRARMEAQLLDAHTRGATRVTIGRLSDYYGPHGRNSTPHALVLEPAIEGKAMRWVGAFNEPHTLHYLPEAARGLITLADHDHADGEAWHLPAAPPITGNAFMDLVNANLPSPVKTKVIGSLAMRFAALFSKDAKETVECMYQWTEPFVVNSARFDAAFGPLQVTPHIEALAQTLEWMARSAAGGGPH